MKLHLILAILLTLASSFSFAEPKDWEEEGKCYFIAVDPANTIFKNGQIVAAADTPCSDQSSKLKKRILVLRKPGDPKIVSINIVISKDSCTKEPNYGETQFTFNVPEEYWSKYEGVTFVKLSEIADESQSECEPWPSLEAVVNRPQLGPSPDPKKVPGTGANTSPQKPRQAVPQSPSVLSPTATSSRPKGTRQSESQSHEAELGW